MRRIYHFIVFLAAALLITAYLSVFINPETFWLPGFLGLYIIPVALLNLFFLLIEVVFRRRRMWFLFLVLSPMLFVLEFYVQFAGKADSDDADGMTMMTYNVGRFRSGRGGMDAEEAMKGVSELIRQTAPDVVCLQEFEVRDTNLVGTLFPGFPYHSFKAFRGADGRWFGNLTLSRYRIVECGGMTFQGSANLSVWTDLAVQGDTLRIYNNHLESNGISLLSLLKKISSRGTGLKSDVVEAHGKLKSSFLRRAGQVNAVAEHLEACSHSSIACGDFNDTPVSFTYHTFYNGRSDTFVEAGRGFGATYSLLWPLLRIDYVFVPESFGVVFHRTLKEKWSDHYPVITRIIYEN